MIDPPGWLEAQLAPMPLTGEALRFDLAAFRSRVTREMLQARLRRTPQAFGAGGRPLAANLRADGSALEVDAAALLAINARVARRLEQGPAGAVEACRRLLEAGVRLDAAAWRLASPLAAGRLPSPRALLACLDASAQDQALGALKFCLPADLRPRLADWFDDDTEGVEAALAPPSRSLWSQLQAQEVALAAARLREPASAYASRLRRFRRGWGYLHGEDVDFREHESEEAIDARAAAAAAGGRRELAERARALRAALRDDGRRKLRARRRLAERLAAGDGGERAARLVSHVLLARALAAHEDDNRRRKMRLLRDLRDLALRAGLPLETASLRAFVAACGASARGPALLASSAS